MPTIGGVHYNTEMTDKQKADYVQDMRELCQYVHANIPDKSKAYQITHHMLKRDPLVQRAITCYSTRLKEEEIK